MIVNQSIKEKEYEFIRDVVSKYRLRLTRNNEGKNPMEIIKKSAGQSAGLRGQPNFRRKIWEFFEQYLSQEPTFIDSADKSSELGEWIHQKNLFKIKEIIEAKVEGVDMNSEKDRILQNLLEQRNCEGKTIFYRAVEEQAT